MPAIAEKGGLDRLRDRGLIANVDYEELKEDVRECTSMLPIILTLDSIANELCDLLEERDRREGKSDNPPEIEEQFWTCPKCGSVMYDITGSGTQRVWRCGSCLHEEKKAEEG